MWDPVDRYAPNGPLGRVLLASVFWIFGIVLAAATVGGSLVALAMSTPFAIVLLWLSVSLGWSGLKGGNTDRSAERRTDSTRDATVDVADPNELDDPLHIVKARYARGELTDEEFERRLLRLLDVEHGVDDAVRSQEYGTGERGSATDRVREV